MKKKFNLTDYKELLEMENKYGAVIRIEPAPEMTPTDHHISRGISPPVSIFKLSLTG